MSGWPGAPAGGPARQTRRQTRRRAAGAAVWLGAGGAGGLLAACATPGTAPPPAAGAKEVTVSYVTDWAGGVREEWLKAAIPRFTEENPRIRVRVDNWTGDIVAIALANAAAGTLQDVMLGSSDLFIQLAKGGEMKDIAPVLKSLRVSMNDVISLPSTISYGGKQYGMPFQFAPIYMVLNKTLYRQAGAALPTEKTTYPEFLEELRKIARPADNVYGVFVQGTPGALGQWLPYVWAYGGGQWSPDRKRSTIGDAGSIEGLQFFVDMAHRQRVLVPIDEKGGTPAGIGFNEGNVAVRYSSAPGPGMDRSIAGKFEWDVMFHPLGPKTNKREIFVNDQANTVTGTAVRRGVFEEAVRFVAWTAASKTAQELIAQIGPSAMPVLKSVATGSKYLAGPPASMSVMTDQIKAFRDPDIFVGWNKWRDDVHAALLPAFAGQKSVPDAARDAARAGDLVLAQIPA